MIPNEGEDIPLIPPGLIAQIQKGNVALLIGAGLSVGAGLPGWNALLSPLANLVNYTGNNYLMAAQYYENQNGRHALISYLRDQLDTINVRPTNNHQILANLPVNIILTTNFDNLLELAYRDAGKSVNLVVGAQDLPYWDELKINIVKLHGSYDRPETIIITEHDYNTIYKSNQLIFRHLNSLLATKTLLFIGYSLSDPDFDQLYDQLQSDLGRNLRKSYIVTFEDDILKLNDLEMRGFYIIKLSNEGNLNETLQRWLLTLSRLC